MARTVRVLIADDEGPARRKIAGLLASDPRFVMMGEARDGDEAASMITDLTPDLVFLDIQMPRKTGFEVIETLGCDRFPRVIFSTAYDAFALRAFEVNAVDYLLKPFSKERFQQSLERVWSTFDDQRTERSKLQALLAEVKPTFPQRILVRDGKAMTPVALADVSHITAEGKYVLIHAGNKSYLHRETLRALETKLDPDRFVRIHRSAMVHIDCIVGLAPWSHGDYRIELNSGIWLTMSRTYRENLMRLMG